MYALLAVSLIGLVSPAAHGIREDGDAKEADVGAAGAGGGRHNDGNSASPARAGWSGRACLQRLLFLLVLLL